MKRPFAQVDVFTARPYVGNGLAVVLDGSGLDAEAMQRFTDWTQLSEATFVLPPSHAEADYRVRIFCPGRELPFAGHPTLGTCHAWLAAGGKPKSRDGVVVQECGVGLVRIRRDRDAGGAERLGFAAPPLKRSGPLEESGIVRLADALGVARADVHSGAWCDNGPGWQALMLRDADAVLALKPDRAKLRGLEVGVIGPYLSERAGVASARGSKPDFEVRAFFAVGDDVLEDPVTGSLNAGLAQWLIPAGLAPERYVARQGTALKREGLVHVERIGQDIWISGSSVTCIEGEVEL